ncbi:MAG: DNA internalization-related competence protein ComEC/Rec2 [Sedimentisphaerales bacterium]|nr:DNA internalization-related competence protein ComEC/Rec2 [Sedimentisphaerales bacterium]
MDEIRQKLERIDRQLRGGIAEYHRQIISTVPLLFAAIGLIAGILVQDTFGLAVWVWLVLVGMCAAATIVLYFVYRCKEEQLPYVLAYSALVCFVCLGAIRLRSYEQLRGDDISNFVGGERILATIRGLIVSKPYVNRNENWEFAKFTHSDPASSFYLELREVETVDDWAKVSGIVRVQVNESVKDLLKVGDYIQVYCWLDRFRKATNPGQFDVAKYLARRNVFVASAIDSRDAIEVLQGGSADFFVKLKSKAREIAVRSLLGGTYPEDESERLLQALVLGYRSEMDIETFEAFRRTGLLHFVCLSGMNFGIFVGMIWWLCKMSGLARKAQAAVCIIATAVFVLVVPPDPPAFRAAIICFIFCLSIFFRRQSNPFNSLALAAIILLVIRPMELFEVSWQLSFATVLGILLLANRTIGYISEKATVLFEDSTTRKPPSYFRVISGIISFIVAVFAVSFVAWLTSAGILLYNFYVIQPLTSIWTVIASPFIAVISFLGYLKLLVGAALPTAASMLGWIIKPLSDLLIWLVKLMARIDFSQILIGHITVWLIVFYYCTILFIAFVRIKNPLVKRAVSVAMILFVAIFLGATKWQRTHRDNSAVTCLDVGHGQAILAQLPGGANLLFDAGSLHSKDIGRRVVLPFLSYSGISRIDSIIISHNDVDHINGIPEIAKCCEVGGVYSNDAFFSQADQWGTAKFLKESLEKKGLEVQHLGKELNPRSNAKAKIIWPVGQMEGLSDNDKSAVCLIEFAGTEILLCSDIEKFAQAELLRLYPDLKADVVIIPHHGSKRTTEQHFLEKLDALILICSCGRSDCEKNRIIKFQSTAEWLCTAEQGAIVVCIDKDGTIR